MNKKQLWLKIKKYHFEHLVPVGLWDSIHAKFGKTDSSTHAFAYKISRQCGWSKAFALKAISEYKKFVYLGVVSDFAVTPSEIIDKVWHRHILFSTAYRQFCDEIIEHHFDHHPELIFSESQTETFQQQYLQTLELYKKEFNTDPPMGIWGNTKFDQIPAEVPVKKKKTERGSDNSSYHNDAPLFTSFPDNEIADCPEFNGFESGDFGGGGASGSWDGSNADSSGEDSGGESGSSCSSGCGGGGD